MDADKLVIKDFFLYLITIIKCKSKEFAIMSWKFLLGLKTVGNALVCTFEAKDFEVDAAWQTRWNGRRRMNPPPLWKWLKNAF